MMELVWIILSTILYLAIGSVVAAIHYNATYWKWSADDSVMVALLWPMFAIFLIIRAVTYPFVKLFSMLTGG